MENLLAPVIVALITGGLSLVGVIITNSAANNKMQVENKTAQAVTDKKIPVLEERVKVLEKDVEDLKK